MSSSAETLFANATLLTMEPGEVAYGRRDEHAVLVRDGLIDWLGPQHAAPLAARVIDCAGHLLTPGLIDCHTHLVFGAIAQTSGNSG